MRANGAKLWSACSSLPLFRQPARWLALVVAGKECEYKPRRGWRFPQESLREGKRQQAARTPKLRSAGKDGGASGGWKGLAAGRSSRKQACGRESGSELAKASLRMPMGGVFPQPVRPRPAVRNAGERPLMDFFHRQKKCQRFVVNDNSFHVASFPLDKANSRAILDAEASTRWRTRKAADLYKGPAQSIPKGRCQVPGVRCQGSGKTLGPSHVTRIASPPLAPDT